jgi:APA family basic amino acid/polyamine antiporter
MINLGAIIGAGIFVIIGIAIGEAGPSIVVSIVISGIIAMLTGLSFAELARHVAKEGGVYEYAKESFRPSAGFIGGWLWTFGNIIAISAVSLSFGGYVDNLFSIGIPPLYFALISIAAFAGINLLGIKNSAKTITVFVVINVAVLILFIIAGIFSFNPSNLIDFAPNGFSGTLTGAAIIFFAFTGFSRITTISDEVKDPERTIPRAIIISIVISIALYAAVAFVAVGMVPYNLLAKASAPLATAISGLHIGILLVIIGIGGVTATSGVILTGILGTSRVLFALGRDGELPKQLSFIDRFSTPSNAIIVSSVLSALFILFISFGAIVDSSNAAVLGSYFIINFSAFYFYFKLKKEKKREKRYIPAVSIAGMLSILLLVAYLDIVSLEIILVTTMIGIFYYAAKNTGLLNRVVGLKKHKIVPNHSDVRTFGGSRVKKD